MKIQNVKNEHVNEQLRGMLLSSNRNFNDLYGYYNKGIMALLRWWGDPDQVMTSFMRAVEEKERREREEKERLEREERERIKREKEEKERQEKEEKERRQRELEEKIRALESGDLSNIDEEERRLLAGYNSTEFIRSPDGKIIGSKMGSGPGSMALMPYSGQRTQSLANIRAK